MSENISLDDIISLARNYREIHQLIRQRDLCFSSNYAFNLVPFVTQCEDLYFSTIPLVQTLTKSKNPFGCFGEAIDLMNKNDQYENMGSILCRLMDLKHPPSDHDKLYFVDKATQTKPLETLSTETPIFWECFYLKMQELLEDTNVIHDSEKQTPPQDIFDLVSLCASNCTQIMETLLKIVPFVFSRHYNAQSHTIPWLILAECALIGFKEDFILNAKAVGPYRFPGKLYDYRYNKMDKEEYAFCSHEAHADGDMVASIMNNSFLYDNPCQYYAAFEISPNLWRSKPIQWYNCWSIHLLFLKYQCVAHFEENLFREWAYTTGKCIDADWVEAKAYWQLDDTARLNQVGDWLRYKLIPNLALHSEHKGLCERANLIIMNGQPKWHAGRVQWTFIRDLDEVIQLFREEISIKLREYWHSVKMTSQITASADNETMELDRNSSPDVPTGNDNHLAKTDVELLDVLTKALPWDGDALHLLKFHDFLVPFRRDDLQALYDFERICENPCSSFIDSDLEKLRLNLLKLVQEFLSLIRNNTFICEHDRDRISIPKDWRWKSPELFRRVPKDLHTTCDKILEIYGALLKTAKKKRELTSGLCKRNLEIGKASSSPEENRLQKAQTTKPHEGQRIEDWSDLTIEVIDDSTIRYRIGQECTRATNQELGFWDKRKHLPNKLWRMFLLLAEHCDNNKISGVNVGCIQKDLDRICGTLKKYFGPKERPIPHDKKGTWSTLFDFRDCRPKTKLGRNFDEDDEISLS